VFRAETPERHRPPADVTAAVSPRPQEAELAVTEAQAPSFHYYLNRHVHLDEDFHAPLSLRLLAALCGDDANKWREAEAAAEAAVNARLQFWDGVLQALPSQHAQAA